MTTAVANGPPKRAPMFGRNQVFLILFVAAIAVLWNVAYYFLSSKDPNGNLFDYQGTSGPFSIRVEGEIYVAGDPISSTKRGGLVGWTTTLCIHKGIAGLGVTELVKTSPGEEQVVNRVETPLPAQETRCGPRTVARLVPLDAPLGYYEVRRQLLLTVNGHPQMPIILPSLHIRVE